MEYGALVLVVTHLICNEKSGVRFPKAPHFSPQKREDIKKVVSGEKTMGRWSSGYDAGLQILATKVRVLPVLHVAL